MQRSTRFGRLLAPTLVAVWLGSPPSPALAQPAEAYRGAKPAEKALQDDDKGLPRISLLRLQVVKPEPPPANMPGGFPRRNRFGFPTEMREGTSLTFVLEEPQESILSVETNDCKITKFRDDRGTDLTLDEAEPAKGNNPINPQFGQEEGPISSEIDPAGHRATITVNSPRLPTGGANRLILDVILAVKYARGEKTIEQKNVNLNLDKIAAAPYSFVVTSQDNPNVRFGRGGPGTQVTLFHRAPQQLARKIVFIGTDDHEIPAQHAGSGQSGAVYQTYYSLAKKVDTCTIRLTVPEKVETVKMAVSIDTGVGFPRFARRRVLDGLEPQKSVTGAAPR